MGNACSYWRNEILRNIILHTDPELVPCWYGLDLTPLLLLCRHSYMDFLGVGIGRHCFSILRFAYSYLPNIYSMLVFF